MAAGAVASHPRDWRGAISASARSGDQTRVTDRRAPLDSGEPCDAPRSVVRRIDVLSVDAAGGRTLDYRVSERRRKPNSMTLSTFTRSHRSQQKWVRGIRVDRESTHSAIRTATLQCRVEALRRSTQRYRCERRRLSTSQCAASPSIGFEFGLEHRSLGSDVDACHRGCFLAMNLSNPWSFSPVNMTATEGFPSRPARPNSCR